jgi:tetratricopeptide (TPR) repeat protein
LPGSFAAQAWARLRLKQLLPEKAINRAEISRLGKTFGLVTPGTSLIVLDRVEDYARYQIRPPAELFAAYERLVAAQGRQAEQDRARHLEEVVRRFKEKQAWWERDFPKGDRPQSKPETGTIGGTMAMESLRIAMPATASGAMRPAPAMAAPRPARMAEETVADKADGSAGAPPVTRIQLKKWLPDAPYVERLRQAENERIYRVYLDERPSYLNSTAFFLDAADIFFERGQPQLATRILSNLAEMDLENRHVLRILAYRLLQAHRADLAVPVLERVLELAPDEPQSWRDLGLAQAENGKPRQAVASLYQVVTRPWHNRFPDIELVALAEMNALLATAPAPIDTATLTPAVDPRLLRNLPLDLRVVLSWDADNTDIDLWVTDPNGEKAYFANRLSYQGGAVSRDFTGGYGPEEFSLRKAKPGKYLVQAQFYGHRQQVVAGATTLNLRLYTAFGSTEQKEERVTLRLKGQSEVVTIGEFIVGD